MNTKFSTLMLGVSLALPIASSRIQAAPTVAGASQAITVFRGEAFFLEKMRLAPGAKLHVSLVGRLAGAEYLPLATTIVSARSGATPFQLTLPTDSLPAGPYRLQAWIVGDNRLLFQGHAPQTMVNSLQKEVKIRLSLAAAPLNIDGIGDGKPIPTSEVQPVPLPHPVSDSEYKLSGQVSKRDRRGISPDAKVVVEVRDVSLQDAPSKLLGSSEVETKGKQLPVQYDMTLIGFDLDPHGRYAVSARVYEGGKLSYISDTHIPFDANKREQTVDIRVVAAR